MITKKLGKEIFAWQPNAFNGKGYWFVVGKKGGLGRAATKEQYKLLGKPQQDKIDPISPKVYEEESATNQPLDKEPEKKTKTKRVKKKKTALSSVIDQMLSGKGLAEIARDATVRKAGDVASFIADKTIDKSKQILGRFNPFGKKKSVEDTSKLGGGLVKKMVGKKDKPTSELKSSETPIISKLNSEEPEEKKKKQKDPFRSTVSGKDSKLQKGDTAANVLAKLYGLINKDFEANKLHDELSKNFEEDRKKKAEKRHKELIDALKSLSGTKESDDKDKKKKDDKEDGGGGGIIDTLTSALSSLGFGKKILGKLKGAKGAAEALKAEKGAVKGFTKFAQAAEGVAEGGLKSASKISKVLKGAKGVLKFLEKIPGLSLIAAGAGLVMDIKDAIDAHEAGEIDDKGLKKVVVEAVGGALGGLGGAELGGILGGAIGSVIPVAGTLVGGALGGVAGFFGGEKLGKMAAGKAFEFFETATDKEPPKDPLKENEKQKEKASPTLPTATKLSSGSNASPAPSPSASGGSPAPASSPSSSAGSPAPASAPSASGSAPASSPSASSSGSPASAPAPSAAPSSTTPSPPSPAPVPTSTSSSGGGSGGSSSQSNPPTSTAKPITIPKQADTKLQSLTKENADLQVEKDSGGSSGASPIVVNNNNSKSLPPKTSVNTQENMYQNDSSFRDSLSSSNDRMMG